MNSKASFAKGRPATFFLRRPVYEFLPFLRTPPLSYCKQQGIMLALCFSIHMTLFWTKHWINSRTWDFEIPSVTEYAGEYLCNLRLENWKQDSRSPSVLSSWHRSPDRWSIKSYPNLRYPLRAQKRISGCFPQTILILFMPMSSRFYHNLVLNLYLKRSWRWLLWSLHVRCTYVHLPRLT